MIWKKNFKKKRRGQGGASRLPPRFWPAGRSRPSPRAHSPPSPRPRAMAGRAVPPWRASRTPPPRGAPMRPGRPPGAPAAPTSPSSLICARPLSLSRSLSLAAPAVRAAARHYRRRSEFHSFVASASSFESTATNDPTSPPRTPRARSIALDKSSSTVRAHVVLPLLSTMGRDSKRVSLASTSRLFPRPRFMLYRAELARPW